jgi:uncharacterized protein (TIGR00303 family)
LQETTNLCQIVFDPKNRASKLVEKISQFNKVDFRLLLASTRLSERENISAAGVNAEARRLTPALDAEALLLGFTKSAPSIPKSPGGIISPVVLTRAALSFLNCQIKVIDLGTFQPPICPHEKVNLPPSRDFTKESSLTSEQVAVLFARGSADALLANQEKTPTLSVLAECVPGGTTTAQAILEAMGLETQGFVSSSLPNTLLNRGLDLKQAVIKQGLLRVSEKYNLSRNQLTAKFRKEPLLAVSELGDAMQAYALGFVLERCRNQPVMLAGGSQMLAVYHLARILDRRQNAHDHSRQSLLRENLLVATTKWVAHDPQAKTAELAKLVEAPYLACHLSLAQSRHQGLRAYEDGNVKEGVGAGAAILLAHILGKACEKKLLARIDNYYQDLTK